MAINAATVWEVRTTGAQTNGGGFADLDPGTSVDYSQQDAAQLNPTDLASDGAGTGISSATGGFTAAMVGNVIRIESTGTFTAGWYQITAYTDTNNIAIDRSAGASKAGGEGKVGGAFALGGSLDDEFFENMASGNTMYIKSGTHTLGETVTWDTDAAAATIHQVIGYNSSRGDDPTGDNRPLIDTGANIFTQGGRYKALANLRFTGTGSSVLLSNDSYNLIYNCKIANTSSSGSKTALSCTGAANYIVACEGTCASTDSTSICIAATGSDNLVVSSYTSGGHTGISLALGNSAFGCVVNGGATYGVNCASYGVCVVNCTIYNCGTGIYMPNLTGLFANNIVDTCTTGISSNSSRYSIWNLVNCLNNTTDLTNVYNSLSSNALATNPGLADPGSGDFSIDSSDTNVYQQGIDVGTYTSATT